MTSNQTYLTNSPAIASQRCAGMQWFIGGHAFAFFYATKATLSSSVDPERKEPTGRLNQEESS